MDSQTADPLEALGQEITDSAPGGSFARSVTAHAPTMGNLQRIRYSHMAMIDFMITNPWASQNQIAAHFGRTAGWISNIIVSDAFQAAFHARREELVDPAMRGSLEEMFKGVVHRSLVVLQEKLAAPAASVSDTVMLKAIEYGSKALGMGGNAPPPAAPEPLDRLEKLADRLLQLGGQRQPKLIEGEVQVIPEGGK